MQKKIRKSFRLSQDADNILKNLSDKLGISETSIIELAIREKAAQLNVSLTTQETQTHENHN